MTKSYLARKTKKLNVWLSLCVLPFLLLIFVAALQIITQLVFDRTSSDAPEFIPIVVNIIAALLGVIAVILLVLIPLWIILYFVTQKKSNE